jgi:hypothetical protein
MGILTGLFLESDEFNEDDQYFVSSTRVYTGAFLTSDDSTSVRANCGFAPYQVHPTDPTQYVVGINAVMKYQEISGYNNPTGVADANDGTPCYWWTISVNFGAWNTLTHTPTGDPSLTPISYSYQWQVFEQAVDVAIVGKNADGSYQYGPVLNSAGDPFDPPVTRDQLRGILKIVQNTLTYPVVTYFNYGNVINNDLWNGFAPYTLKFSPPSMPERPFSQYLNKNYYRNEAEIIFNPYTWNAQPIDRGFNYLVGGQKAKVLDAGGTPVSTPVLLDGSGDVLASPSYNNITIFNFQVYQDITFSTTFPAFANLFN